MKRRILLTLSSIIMVITFVFNDLHITSTFAIDSSMEIISLRSEYGKCFNNNDGTTTTFINTVPMHYYNGNEWVDIDNSLIYENGSYTNINNSMNVTLAENTSVSSIEAAYNEPMVQIESDGYKIGWNFIDNNFNNNFYKDISILDVPTSNIKIEDSKEVKFSLDNNKITDNIIDTVTKLESSAIYNSIYNNVDVNIEVKPKSVKETIILNNSDVPEQFVYFIQCKDLEATIYEDNTVHFYNNENEIFTIPTPYMFDSSDNLENNYDINVEMEKYKDGYLYTITPDKKWLMSEERVYPVIIDPEFVSTYRKVSTTYNSENNPSTVYNENSVQIGGKVGNRYEAIVYAPESFEGPQFQGDIINATFNMYFASNDRPGNNSKIEVHYLEECSPDWNNSGGGVYSNRTYISTLDTIPEYKLGYRSFDITKLVQYWANYANTDGMTGVIPYGFKLKTSNTSTNSRIFVGLSERNSSNTPYFEISHKISKYASIYNSNKYDANVVKSFQNRMNCYSYALQMYYKGNDDTYYWLMPGEIGIGQENDGIYTYDDLNKKYRSCKNAIELMELTDKQMKKDAKAMNYSIINLNDEYSISNQDKFLQYINNSYNEYEGRIIALVTGYVTSARTYDYHYYMRHGNGTCSEHDGNCSIWSHKVGYKDISNHSLNGSPILCDKNIFSSSTYASDYSNGPVFYNIGKNMNVYNSYYYNGHTSDSQGTSFFYMP